MTGRRAGTLALVAALTLFGCQASPESESDGRGAQAEQAPEVASPEVSTPSEGSGEDAHGEMACDEETLAAIDQTIAGQLEAFADGDYAAALGFSSERFRSLTDVPSFRHIIETDYPVLTDAGGHTSTLCVAGADHAQLLVSVEPADGSQGAQELVYDMVRENGEWLIDSAGSPRSGGPAENGGPVDV